jgi:hypothetical protein
VGLRTRLGDDSISSVKPLGSGLSTPPSAHLEDAHRGFRGLLFKDREKPFWLDDPKISGTP